ncbi:MAG TPA: hypothetical protein P5262_02235 [Candidatus Moranbacteria bacterium]|nr:hypothetical protein [Candidatus Moranbacteria bacterium]
MEEKDKNVKNEYVTKGYLEEQLGEQAKVIISAVDEMFGKHKAEINERFSGVNERFSEIDERFSGVNERFSEIDERLEEIESNLGKKIDNIQALIDGYVKAQEDFKQEFVIMKEEVRQMKQIFKEKLGVEIRAI